jgi:hypothetical protein
MIQISKWFLYIIAFTFPYSAFGAPECDRKAQPWLDAACKMPEKGNPEHACRYVEYMKANGIDPKDPKLMYVIPINDKDFIRFPDSYENMAAELCENLKKSRCSETAGLLFSRYAEIMSVSVESNKPELPPYLGDNITANTDPNLTRNFELVTSLNSEVLNLIDSSLAAIKTASEGVKTYKEFTDADTNINNVFQKIRNRNLALAEKELRLSYLIENMVRAIGINAEMALVRSLGFECDFSNDLPTAKYNESLAKTIETLNNVRREVKDASDERNNLIKLAYYKGKYFIYEKYAAQSNQNLNTLLEALNKDLWLTRKMWDFADWWSSIFVNGIANNLHTKYYYYSEPLKIIRSQKEIALRFKDEIKSNKLYEKETGSIALKTIDDKISILDSSAAYIESKGWSGLLAIQKASARKRAELLPGNSKCQAAASAFLGGAEKVTDVSSYDQNSPLFKTVLEACQK